MSALHLENEIELPQAIASGPHIDEYRRYREISKQLHQKITALPEFGRLAELATVHLGLQRERLHELEMVESDVTALLDYSQWELLERGKNILEIYRASALRQSLEEEQLLDAYQRAEANVFRATDADPLRGHVMLQQITDPSRQLVLIDCHWSASYAAHRMNVISFMRPISVAGFVMTSGFNCLFPASKERTILKDWHKHSSSVRFAKTFRLHKSECGLPMLLR